MTRRQLLIVGLAGVALIVLWLVLVVSWRWIPLAPGLFCLYLFFTAEATSDVSSPRS